MLLVLLLGLFCPNFIWAQDVNNVVLERGKPYEISNPTYPNNMDWKDASIEWNLQAEGNGYIKIVCTDIRMAQTELWSDKCPNVYISIIDGNGEKKICASGIFNFVHKSDGPNLKVKAVTTTQGTTLFKCIAMNNAEPDPEEIIRLDTDGKARRIVLIADENNPLPYLNRQWNFESPEGSRISFQCGIRLGRLEPDCGFEVLTFHNGIEDEEYCTGGVFVQFSKINKAKLRLQLNHFGHGSMACIIQAVTGPNANEYENIVSEEVDSSEHGVTAGTKNTSCKCGWANKGGARIINGEETKINEFPWMVHILVRMQTEVGSWAQTCGASIITPRHVLTAAHCVVAGKTIASGENIDLALGKHNGEKPSGKEVIIKGEKVLVPEIYLEKGLTFHDIAIIFTKQTITYNNIIGPICIEREDYPVINRHVTIMGWGLTQESKSSPYLKKARVIVMDNNICGGNDWDVCTQTEPQNFCTGDSGGPVVWLDKETNRYSQISVISRVPAQCKGKTPSVSTRVSFFYDWIHQVIRDTDPSVDTCHKM